MAGEGKTVCVTGASGFIASWLVNHLLRRGYTVKATVRDLYVADAHIQAFEIPSANGRYCLSERDLRLSDVADVLVQLYPSIVDRLPQKFDDDDGFSPPYPVSREKAKTLGIDFTPFEVSLKETVESLKLLGSISF